MLFFLVLSACAGVGFSFDTYEETYGSTHRIFLPSKAESIEFRPQYEPGRNVLWERGDPQTLEDSRRKVTGSYYVIKNVTQKDSGRYIIKDKDRTILVWHDLEVKAQTLEYSMMPGQTFTFSSVLEGINCNIYFYPGNGNEQQHIVYRGRLDDQSLCSGLQYEKTCGIYSSGVQHTCDGRFEFRDQYNNQAVVVVLEVENSEGEKPYVGATVGAVGLIIFGTCLKMCCVRKSSATKNNANTPSDDDEPAANNGPAVFYHEGRHGPVGPRTDPNPAQPSVPLIHSPPHTVPSYSEIPPTAEPPSYSEVMSRDGAQMFPLSSGPELRYEVKGMTFDSAPPLSSDTAEPSVYTSEKLNFL